MRTATLLGLLPALLLGLGGCSIRCTVRTCCPRPCAQGERIALDLPDAVHAAVRKAVPGFAAREVEIESEDGLPIYELEGRGADGRSYEIEVDPQGNVRAIETHDGDGPGDEAEEDGDENQARDED